MPPRVLWQNPTSVFYWKKLSNSIRREMKLLLFIATAHVSTVFGILAVTVYFANSVAIAPENG
jgi:hypothetical protein